MLFFSFWLASFSIRALGFSTSIQLTYIHSFYGQVIFHYVYIPQLLYPFICQWTSRLFPCPGYCKECGNEHWSTCVFLNYGFLSIILVVGFLGHRVVCLFLVFNGVSILFSIAAVSIYIPTNSARGFPFLHTLSSIYCLERVRISTYVSRTAFWVPQMGRYLKVRSSRTCLGQSPWRGSWGSSLLDSWMITSTVTPESLLLAKKQREKKKISFTDVHVCQVASVVSNSLQPHGYSW